MFDSKKGQQRVAEKYLQSEAATRAHLTDLATMRATFSPAPEGLEAAPGAADAAGPLQPPFHCFFTPLALRTPVCSGVLTRRGPAVIPSNSCPKTAVTNQRMVPTQFYPIQTLS